jgi:hypothetical protein
MTSHSSNMLLSKATGHVTVWRDVPKWPWQPGEREGEREREGETIYRAWCCNLDVKHCQLHKTQSTATNEQRSDRILKQLIRTQGTQNCPPVPGSADPVLTRICHRLSNVYSVHSSKVLNTHRLHSGTNCCMSTDWIFAQNASQLHTHTHIRSPILQSATSTCFSSGIRPPSSEV